MKLLSCFLVSLFAISLLAAEPEYKVLCFGDSITEGKIPATLKEGERWIDLLEKKSEGKVVCYNEGKAGRTATSFVDFEPAMKRHPEANVLLIALGTYDSQDYSKEKIQEFRKNMVIMACLTRARYPNIKKVVLCAPYNINVDALKNGKEKGPKRRENLVEFGKIVKKLATQEKLGCIDFYGVLPETSLTTDGVHPDAAGHAAIAEKAWAEFQKQVLK